VFTGGSRSSVETVAVMEQKISEYREKPIEISEEILAQIRETGEELPVLTVWHMEYDRSVKNAIRAFSEKRNDVRIESLACPAGSYEEGVLRMSAEIMSGEGPDIVFFTQTMFNSLYKTMESGAFCDLNPLIDNDDTFGSLDLNRAVLDSAVYRGKRYFIPLRYSLPLLISTRSILEENGVSISDDWTLEDMKNIMHDFAANAGERHFFSYAISFESFVNFCGKKFVDYENSQSFFHSEEFISLLELYKEIHPYITPYSEVPTAERPEDSMKNNRFVMDLDTRLSPEELMMSNSIYNAILGEDMVLYPFPTMDGGTERPVIILNAVAVNQNCRNKEAALDFIEELLSTDIQAAHDKYGNSNNVSGLPVNHEAFRRDLDFAVYKADTEGAMLISSISSGSSSITRSFPMLRLPEDLAARMNQLAENVVVMPIRDNALAEIIGEGFMSFIEGRSTAEQTARDIDEKVRLFLSE